MQTNEELRRAAERVRATSSPPIVHDDYERDTRLLACAYLAEHPADDGAPAWRDRPPVAGKYLKYRRTSGALFAKATIVACPEHTADVDLCRWYGPIPADAAAGPVESTP